jgi:hypothetical protein
MYRFVLQRYFLLGIAAIAVPSISPRAMAANDVLRLFLSSDSHIVVSDTGVALNRCGQRAPGPVVIRQVTARIDASPPIEPPLRVIPL